MLRRECCNAIAYKLNDCEFFLTSFISSLYLSNTMDFNLFLDQPKENKNKVECRVRCRDWCGDVLALVFLSVSRQ